MTARQPQTVKPSPRPFDVDDLRLMGLVAHAGSLTAAARQSDISKSVLSRALAKLETVSEGPIFYRSRRGLQLTSIGEALLPVAERAIAVARDAEEAMRFAAGTPQGDLRIAASSLATKRLVTPVLKRLRQEHPLIRPTVLVSSQGPDPVEANLDVVIRVGKPAAPHLVARTLFVSPLAIYACATLASKIDIHDPVAVEGLGRVVVDVDSIPSAWSLSSTGQNQITMASAPIASVSDPVNALDMLKEGFGVSLLMESYADPLVQRGELTKLLPSWSGPLIEICAAFPVRRASVPAVTVFLEALNEQLNALQGSGNANLPA